MDGIIDEQKELLYEKSAVALAVAICNCLCRRISS